MIKLSVNGVVYMIAMYAAFLATGHTIALKSIKSRTVKKYLSNIAKFLQNFDEGAQPTPTYVLSKTGWT